MNYAERNNRVEGEPPRHSGLDLDELMRGFHNPPNINYRQWASEAIAKQRPEKKELEVYLERFRQETSKLQRFLLKAIAHSQSEAATGALVEALHAQDDETRWLAVLNLSERTIDDRQRQQIESYINKNYRKKKMSSVMNTLCLLRNETFHGSKYRTYFLEHVTELDLSAKSVVLAQAWRWLPSDQAADLLHRFSMDEQAGIRETILDALIESGADKSAMEIFSSDQDPYIAKKAKKFLGIGEKETIPEIPQEKSSAILLAAAIGDAVGAQVEFLRREDILKIYGGEVDEYVDLERHGQKLRIEPGEETDDTAMGLMILDAFLEQGFFDPSLVGRKFGEEMRSIDHAEKPNIGYAAKSSMDMRKLSLGCNWRFSGHRGTGCGAAMRVFALPMFSESDDKLKQNAFDSANITHDSEIGRASAYAVAKAIADLLRSDGQMRPEQFLDDIYVAVKDISPDFALRLLKIKEYLDLPVLEGLAKIGTESDAVETVPAAFYVFLKSPENFSETLRHASNVDGDSDSIASIACAMSAAYNGLSAIPEKLIRGLKRREEIAGRANRLSNM